MQEIRQSPHCRRMQLRSERQRCLYANISPRVRLRLKPYHHVKSVCLRRIRRNSYRILPGGQIRLCQKHSCLSLTKATQTIPRYAMPGPCTVHTGSSTIIDPSRRKRNRRSLRDRVYPKLRKQLVTGRKRYPHRAISETLIFPWFGLQIQDLEFLPKQLPSILRGHLLRKGSGQSL